MSTLALYSNSAAVAVRPAPATWLAQQPQAQQQAIAAYQAASPMLRQQEANIVAAHLLGRINGVLFLLGHKKQWDNDADQSLFALQVAQELQRTNPTLKVEEIELAWKRGAAGLYKNRPDEVVLVNYPNLCEWVRKYAAEARKEALVALADQRRQEEEAAEAARRPTQATIDAANVATLVDLLQRHRQDEEVFGPEATVGHYLFGWLEELGLLVLSNAEKARAYKEQREAMLHELAEKGVTHPLRPNGQAERRQYTAFVDAVAAGLATLAGNTYEAEVRLRCRNAALWEWATERLNNTPAEDTALLTEALAAVRGRAVALTRTEEAA